MFERMSEPITQLFSSMSMKLNESSFSSPQLLYNRPFTRPISMIVTDMFNPVPINTLEEHRIPIHLFMTNSLSTLLLLYRVAKGEIPSQYLTPKMVQQFFKASNFADGLISNSVRQLEESYINQLHSQIPSLSNKPLRFVAPLIPVTIERTKGENVCTRIFEHYFTKFLHLFRVQLLPSCNG